MKGDFFHKLNSDFHSKGWVGISKEGEGQEKVFCAEETALM